jgi:hypothetical protein
MVMSRFCLGLFLFFLLTFSASAADNAQFISQSVPSSMVGGQSYAVSVTMKNTGASAWTAEEGYRLGSQNPHDNSNWGANRVYMTSGESVAPGQSKTFYFSVKAPGSPGTYNFQWRMLRESVEWFGDTTTNVPVNVSRMWNAYLNSPHHSFKGVGWNIQANALTDNQRSLFDEASPQFIRFVWVIESYHTGDGSKIYESSWAKNNIAFLQHAKDKNISVMLSNWNAGGSWDEHTLWPDHPFWLSEIAHNDPANSQNRFCYNVYAGDPGYCSSSQKSTQTNVQGPETDHPYSDAVFAQTLTDNIDYMVNEKNCRVDFLSMWNEPAGDWAYHPRDANKKYPASFTGLYQNAYQQLQQKNLSSRVKLVGSDDSNPSTAIMDYSMNYWGSYVQAYSLHNYDNTVGSNGPVKYFYDRAAGKPVLVGEIGHRCDIYGTGKWASSLETTRLLLSDARYGAYAIARWWFDGGGLDCFSAVNGDAPVAENYNSLKILANSLPQINENISVVNTDFGDFDANFDAVVINADPSGLKSKPVFWAVNKNLQDYIIALNLSGLTESVSFATRYMTGVSPYSIQAGLNYTVSPENSLVIFTVPANSIFVAQGDAADCVPYSVSGCRVCVADGSGWLDDGSRCAAGLVCFDGACVDLNDSNIRYLRAWDYLHGQNQLSSGMCMHRNDSVRFFMQFNDPNTATRDMKYALDGGKPRLWASTNYSQGWDLFAGEVTIYDASQDYWFYDWSIPYAAPFTSDTIRYYTWQTVNLQGNKTSSWQTDGGFNICCSPVGHTCAADGDCCSGICSGGQCSTEINTTTTTTSSTTTTSTTTTASSTSTTSTTMQQCVMSGNYPPCGEVALSEVVAAINRWAADEFDLGEIISLINSWADPSEYPPQ